MLVINGNEELIGAIPRWQRLLVSHYRDAGMCLDPVARAQKVKEPSGWLARLAGLMAALRAAHAPAEPFRKSARHVQRSRIEPRLPESVVYNRFDVILHFGSAMLPSQCPRRAWYVPLVLPLVHSPPTPGDMGWHVAEVSAIPLLARRMTSLSVARWRATKLRSAPVLTGPSAFSSTRGGRSSEPTLPIFDPTTDQTGNQRAVPSHRNRIVGLQRAPVGPDSLGTTSSFASCRVREGRERPVSPPTGQRTPISKGKRLRGMSL